jgi:DNA-binding NarL/FixJ family response regulator
MDATTRTPPDAARSVPRGPYRATRTDPLGLSARERCVFGLLQTGLSNRAIALRLHRSQRTVEHHVAAVLAKLGAASRAELRSADECAAAPRNLGRHGGSQARPDSTPFRK